MELQWVPAYLIIFPSFGRATDAGRPNAEAVSGFASYREELFGHVPGLNFLRPVLGKRRFDTAPVKSVPVARTNVSPPRIGRCFFFRYHYSGVPKHMEYQEEAQGA